LDKRRDFLAILCIANTLDAIVVFVLLFSFRASWVSPFVILLRVGLPGLGYVVLATLILGRERWYFDSGYFKVTGEAYNGALKAIGAIPLKKIALTAALENVFLAGVFVQGASIGIAPGTGWFLYLLCLSLGLLAGTFVYVLTDRLVSTTLIANGLTFYPRNLREGRLGMKMLVIPIVVAVISVLYGFSSVLMILIRSGGSIHDMKGGDWGVLTALIAVWILVVGVLAFTLKKSTSTLFDSVIRQFENLSSAKKDLTQRVSICSIDEVGSIAGMVNSFCENMEAGLREVKGCQGVLSGSGLKLEENVSGIAESLDRISEAVGQVKAMTEQQLLRSVSESSAAIHEIAKNIESLDNSISTQALSMSQASAAVEEMIGNIASIGKVTKKMAVQFKTVDEAAVMGGAIQQESGKRISEIVEQSHALQEANQIIAAIAAQTNLLAMNAAIEAAHAGDAGRGFSVVADEIRKLAESSSEESRKISAELKQIGETIEHIVKNAQAAELSFAQVSARVNETGKLVQEVDNAISEQEDGAGQVLEALRVMNNVTADVRTGSREMNVGNESMLKEISFLQDHAHEIAVNVAQMAAGIKTVNAGAKGISGLALSNQAAIAHISQVLDGFTV
jgi:methyl-accepting chemotaxis protein